MRTLLAAVDELHAVLEELAGNLEDLLNLIGHCARVGKVGREDAIVGMQLGASRVKLGGGRRRVMVSPTGYKEDAMF